MIDKEHGLKATIAAGGIAVLTACCLFAVKPAAVADTGSSTGEPAISQDAAAQEEQPEENTAAAQEGQPEENTAAAQEGQPVNPEAYEEREVPVFRETATEEKITLRFYEDMPNVAYVNIADYHHLYLPQAEVTSEKTGEGSSAYLVRIDTGSAVIDTEKETLTSDDYLEFTNVMGQTQPGMRNAYLDGIPYVRWSSEEATPAQVPVELDYSKYGIDLANLQPFDRTLIADLLLWFQIGRVLTPAIIMICVGGFAVAEILWRARETVEFRSGIDD